MSTTFILLPLGEVDQSMVPSLEITESSAQFDIDCYFQAEDTGDGLQSWPDLTADQTIDIALKILNVVLYSYPKKMPEIVRKLQGLWY